MGRRSRSTGSTGSPELEAAIPACAGAPEAGFSIIEVLVGAVLGLMVVIAVYTFTESSNRSYVRESDLSAAQNSGRVAMELFSSEARQAGYSPQGKAFAAIPEGNATRVRLIADLNGNGAPGTGDADENVVYNFLPSGDGTTSTLQRGIDLDGDWSFAGAGESVATVVTDVVPVDADGDGTPDPFLAYDVSPANLPLAYLSGQPVTRKVTITFGIRCDHRNTLKKTTEVVTFQSNVTLRNRS